MFIDYPTNINYVRDYKHIFISFYPTNIFLFPVVPGTVALRSSMEWWKAAPHVLALAGHTVFARGSRIRTPHDAKIARITESWPGWREDDRYGRRDLKPGGGGGRQTAPSVWRGLTRLPRRVLARQACLSRAGSGDDFVVVWPSGRVCTDSVGRLSTFRFSSIFLCNETTRNAKANSDLETVLTQKLY
jgi:hypothetical protein